MYNVCSGYFPSSDRIAILVLLLLTPRIYLQNLVLSFSNSHSLNKSYISVVFCNVAFVSVPQISHPYKTVTS